MNRRNVWVPVAAALATFVLVSGVISAALITSRDDGGSGADGPAGQTSDSNLTASEDPEPFPPEPGATNASGQTYGVWPPIGGEAKMDRALEEGPPDLVAVIADNGREGYVYYDEVFGPPTVQPDDTSTDDTSKVDQRDSAAVYLSDGKTVVGEFSGASEDDITVIN